MFADHAFLHAVLLVSASSYIRAQDTSLSNIDLMQLRDMAMAEVRQALTDKSRMISDSLAAAIAHLASYEALSGSRTICKTHMEGLTALVRTRGGLSALGFDGQLEHIILWTNSNASGIL
jgi:hypothetical protein